MIRKIIEGIKDQFEDMIPKEYKEALNYDRSDELRR